MNITMEANMEKSRIEIKSLEVAITSKNDEIFKVKEFEQKFKAMEKKVREKDIDKWELSCAKLSTIELKPRFGRDRA